MNKKILFLITLMGTACDDVTNLEYYCNNKVSCWLPPGAENTESNIIFEFDSEEYEGREGFCGTGITVCEEDNVRCEGVRHPKQEICDNIDNDCNGVVDDPELFYAGIANTKCYFEEVGECRYSEQACINGELLCLYSTAPYYGPEICDGKDNDCDGEYDEELPAEFVYSGPIETVNVGECKAGVTKCIDGKEEIFGMILPREEICDNGKDDDCDGLQDERESGIASVDYAFFIDFSGSMQGSRLESVIQSVCSFTQNPIFIDSRFAMVGISIGSYGNVMNIDQQGLHLITDFTDILTACQTLTDFINQTVYPGMDEYQVDAVLNSFGEYPTSLSWSDRQRKVYIFSDEQPQTTYISLESRLNNIVDSCIQNNFDIGIFTQPYLFSSGWDTILEGCNGFIEDIDNLSNQYYFEQNFLIWFGGSC